MLETEHDRRKGARILPRGKTGSSTGEPPPLSSFALEALGIPIYLPNSSGGSNTVRERREKCCPGELGQRTEKPAVILTAGLTKLSHLQHSHELLGTGILKDWAAAGKSFSAFLFQTRVEVL